MTSSDPAAPGYEPSHEELPTASERLRRRIVELEQEKRDLELMLETSAAHGDHVAEMLESERNDLATMLEMTTEHADTVEDELHERATAALLRSARELRMILEATPAPVMIARWADGEIVYANVMLGTLFGTSAQSLIGRKTADLYFDAAEREPMIRALEAERALDHHELRFRRLDGTVPQACTYSPLTDRRPKETASHGEPQPHSQSGKRSRARVLPPLSQGSSFRGLRPLPAGGSLRPLDRLPGVSIGVSPPRACGTAGAESLRSGAEVRGREPGLPPKKPLRVRPVPGSG